MEDIETILNSDDIYKIVGVIVIIGILVCLYCFKDIDNDTELDNQFTICVKTIYRHKAIGKFVFEMRKLFPTTTIIIADDSDDEYKKLNIKSINEASPNDKNIIYLSLPFDSGVSYGRNKCVEHVKTPYTIITDDTRVLTNKKDLYNSIRYLDKNPQYDMITGSVKNRDDNGIHSHYAFTFDKIYDSNNNLITDKDNLIKLANNLSPLKVITNNSFKNKDGYYEVNIGLQNFIVRTNVIKNNLWNTKLKTGDHEDYFLRLWINNINILYDEDFIFYQLGNEYRKYDKNGANLRYRANNLNNIDLIYNNYKIN